MNLGSNDTFRSIGILAVSITLTAGTLLGVHAAMSSAGMLDNGKTTRSKVAVGAVSLNYSLARAETVLSEPDPNASPVPAVELVKTVDISAKFDANGSDVNEMKSGKVGVGVIPAIRFNHAVPDSSKGAVASNYRIFASDTSEVQGTWAWTTDKVLRFRPVKFWPGHETFTVLPVEANIVLVATEDKVVTLHSPEAGWEFETVRSLVAKVSARTHRMYVYVDGKKVKNFPISLGKSGWETRSGVKVLSGEKEASKTYTNVSVGDPSPYRLTAPWNTRLTPSGEFMHSAPWAYGRLGSWNGSHGCTNMRIEDAKWIYTKTVPGDVFVYSGTSKKMEPTNGPGGLWNVSEGKWKAAQTKVLR